MHVCKLIKKDTANTKNVETKSRDMEAAINGLIEAIDKENDESMPINEKGTVDSKTRQTKLNDIVEGYDV